MRLIFLGYFNVLSSSLPFTSMTELCASVDYMEFLEGVASYPVHVVCVAAREEAGEYGAGLQTFLVDVARQLQELSALGRLYL